MVTRPVRRQAEQSGFTYLLLIIAVAIIGVGLAAIGAMASASTRSSKLQQLNWTGRQYVNAIGDYYQSSPGTISVYPPTLSDLIEDHRYLSVRRHLRELYVDPATDIFDWRVVMAPNGGVMGVESTATEFTAQLRFVYLPPTSTLYTRP